MIKPKNLFYRLFLKSLILFVIVASSDFMIGNVLRFCYFRQTSGYQRLITYALNDNKSGILVMGSSRANHHYIPWIFESRLKTSCFNAGMDGQGIVYSYAELKCILKRYKPQTVILDFNLREFIKDPESYERLSVLFPYYKDYPELKPIVDLMGPYERIKLQSNIYPYNSNFLSILIHGTEFNKKERGEEDNKGFIPMEGALKEPVQTGSPDKYELDYTKIEMFKQFITTLKKSGIKLYIVCSPYFMNFSNPDKSLSLGMDIASKYNVPFYDFSQSKMFLEHPELFSDKGHLNLKGAEMFSGLFINKIVESTGGKFYQNCFFH